MNVFAYYDASPEACPDQAEFVTFWERSWRNRGWTPRLLTARHARRSRFYVKQKRYVNRLPLLALHAVGGGLLVPLSVINFDTQTIRGRGLLRDACGIYMASKTALGKYFNHSASFSSFKICVWRGQLAWDRFGLVKFEKPDEVLSCGRRL